MDDQENDARLSGERSTGKGRSARWSPGATVGRGYLELTVTETACGSSDESKPMAPADRAREDNLQRAHDLGRAPAGIENELAAKAQQILRHVGVRQLGGLGSNCDTVRTTAPMRDDRRLSPIRPARLPRRREEHAWPGEGQAVGEARAGKSVTMKSPRRSFGCSPCSDPARRQGLPAFVAWILSTSRGPVMKDIG